MSELLESLAQCSVFASLSRNELQHLSKIIKQEELPQGTVIFDVNKKPEYLYYIQHGSFTLCLPNNEYKTLVAGQLMGEIGVLNKDYRSGTVYAAEPSTVISISGTGIFDTTIIPPVIALKITKALATQITQYLRSREQISTMELIRYGENDHVEFKSTLRWNLFRNKADKAIEHAVLKTLAAFMNSSGGVLIIGVADDRSVLGLKNDRFKDHDKMLLHLTNLVRKRIGPLHAQYLNFAIESVAGEHVLRVDCAPGYTPAYVLGDNADHLYIRSGPSTTDVRLSKVYDYICERFRKI